MLHYYRGRWINLNQITHIRVNTDLDFPRQRSERSEPFVATDTDIYAGSYRLMTVEGLPDAVAKELNELEK